MGVNDNRALAYLFLIFPLIMNERNGEKPEVPVLYVIFFRLFFSSIVLCEFMVHALASNCIAQVAEHNFKIAEHIYM